MKRNQLLTLLHDYIPTRDEEQAKEVMLTFINQYENCFERTLEIGHITASCWLLNKEHTQALLMHHKKLNRWLQLGGHCDGDSDVLRVALKEAQEESGIIGIEPIHDSIFDLDIHLIPETKKEKAHYHYDVRFLLHVVSDEQIMKNEESNDLRWIDKNRSLIPTDEPTIHRLFNKWIGWSKQREISAALNNF